MTTQDKNQVSESRKRIIAAANKAVKMTTTFQEFVHKDILLPAAIHGWKYKDGDTVKDVLNILIKAHKTFRVESVAYWLKEFAGFDVQYIEKDNAFKVRMNYMGRSGSELGHEFTYDTVHAAILRDPQYRYWKVAPVKIQVLKLPDSVDKLFTPFEQRLARAMLVGAYDETTIQAEVNKIIANAKQMMKDRKNKDWAVEYFDQNPDKVPVVADATAAAIAAEEERIRIEQLDEVMNAA